MMSVVATLAAGFALLLFVFIRKALTNASANPESAAKLASIRQSFGFRSID
jgi:cyanate permease